MESAGSNTSILLVEDEGLIALAEAQMLSLNGYNVTTALKGEDALLKAEGSDIDLVVLDINLGRGRIDGTETARKILQKREIPVIFLTSHSEKKYLALADKIYHYGYLLKHESDEKILETIENAVSTFYNNRRKSESD